MSDLQRDFDTLAPIAAREQYTWDAFVRIRARIAELTTERDDALRKFAGARKYKEIVVKQKKKYVYVASLAELAGAGNDKALACLLPCATVARDPGRNLKDVTDAALAASGGVFGKTADPYTDLEQAK